MRGPRQRGLPRCSAPGRGAGAAGGRGGVPPPPAPPPPLQISVLGSAGPFAVSCFSGDYSCQAQQLCQLITNHTCVWQAYDCNFGIYGSWYPTGGIYGSQTQSGYTFLNFAYSYGAFDVSSVGRRLLWGNGIGQMGNICYGSSGSAAADIFHSLGLTTLRNMGYEGEMQNSGWGLWNRV
jgi:hypothetical protein